MLNITGGDLSGGYRKYLQRLVPRLRSHAAVSELFVSVPPGFEHLNDVGDVRSWKAGEQWRGFGALRREVLAWRADVVLVPTARTIDCNAPCVSMVRNMQPMLPATLRNGVVDWTKTRLRKHLAQQASARASRVIAVSDFVRNFLVNEWHVNSERVGRVYHGVDIAARVDQVPEQMRAMHGRPFVFAAGSLLPYRGLEDAVAALPLVRSKRCTLVIAGDGSAAYRERIAAQIRALGVAEQVVWLGQVNSSVITWGYQNCLAFLMTSRVEACPNTALEAMASGSLCISATCDPMPEFFGRAALYYEAGDAAGLAEKIDFVANLSVAERTAMSEAAIARVSTFTWDGTAEGTVGELQKALA